MRLSLGFFVLGLCTGAFGDWKDEIKFLLYTRANTHSPQIVSKIPLSIQQSHFSGARKTKFIIHGMSANGETSWVTSMVQAILTREDVNVFAVDWSGGAAGPAGVGNCRPAGALIEQFIKQLYTTARARYADFHLIGHSLGAHVSGYAAENIPGLGRITGLDPAGFMFEDNDPKDRLDPTDAVFVDAIHTDSILFGKGIKQPVGHVDYFPNRGGQQPGCWGWVGNSCSHERAYELFIESIKSNCLFRSYPCSNSFDFMAGRCKSCGTGCANMGYNSQRPRSGTYYLSTNDKSPYCKG